MISNFHVNKEIAFTESAQIKCLHPKLKHTNHIHHNRGGYLGGSKSVGSIILNHRHHPHPMDFDSGCPRRGPKQDWSLRHWLGRLWGKEQERERGWVSVIHVRQQTDTSPTASIDNLAPWPLHPQSVFMLFTTSPVPRKPCVSDEKK